MTKQQTLIGDDRHMGRRRVRDTELDLEVRAAIRRECDARGIKFRRYWDETELYKDVTMQQFYIAMAGEEMDAATIGKIENSLTIWRDVQSQRGGVSVAQPEGAVVSQLDEIQRSLSRLQAEIATVVRVLADSYGAGEPPSFGGK